MSTWHVRAIERLGTPQLAWPTIYGPTSGADPLVANGLRTVDLTPYLLPLDTLSQELERDLMRAAMAGVSLNLMDPSGTVAALLGPLSATLATSARYFGPWIQIEERWETVDTGDQSAVRFTGYLDELSLEWDEEGQTTRFNVLHTSNLLKERVLTDHEGLLRPWPRYPSPAVDVHAVLGDDILLDPDSPYTHAQRVAREQALWSTGQFSWVQGMTRYWTVDPVEGGYNPNGTYDPPEPPALTVKISGEPYAIESVGWSTYPGDLYFEVPTAGTAYAVAIVRLSGAPDLSAVLYEGAAIEWPLTEAETSYYFLAESVPEPPEGEEGQSWLDLTSVEHLVAGDTLTVTMRKAGKREKRDILISDVDGTTNRVYTSEPQEALPGPGGTIIRIRRDSRDPVLVDGVAFARRACSPWTLDTTQLTPALTSWPVLSWLPLDAATPEFYGMVDIQGCGSQVQISRRGAQGTTPATGVWRGPVGGPWAWTYDNLDILKQWGQDTQWPSNDFHAAPMALYVEGDMTGAPATPPNGWRRISRSLSEVQQGGETTTVVQDGGGAYTYTWSTTPTTAVPAKLVAYSAWTSAGQGMWSRTSAGVWSWTPFGGSASTITPSGTLPTGSWIALGMGLFDQHDMEGHQESIMGLVVATPAETYTSVQAVILGPNVGGALTAGAPTTLTTGTPSVWALGGGLVFAVFSETLAGLPYQHTRVWRLDGTIAVGDLPTLEVLPGTVQPLSPDADGLISGWTFLALESYANDEGEMRRRARLVKIDQALNIANGDAEPNPTEPLNPSVAFRRGALVADPVPAGVITARMIRTGIADEMIGILGGRLFSVAPRINRTVERIQVTGMNALSYVELLGQGLLAHAVPKADGNLALVSRTAGSTRTLPGNSAGAIVANPCGIWFGSVRVGYTAPGATGSTTLTVNASRLGGKVLDFDLGKVLNSPSQAYAVAVATATFWGQPASARQLRISDPLCGPTTSDMPPVFWAGWNVGDRMTFGGMTHKITRISHHLEARQADFELLEIVEPS